MNDVPSLSDAERAAIVDLMTGAMHANGVLKTSENHVFDLFARRLGWSVARLRERFAAVVAPIGTQMVDPAKQAAFVTACGARLTSDDARALAIEACDAITRADGERSPGERAYLDRVLHVLDR